MGAGKWELVDSGQPGSSSCWKADGNVLRSLLSLPLVVGLGVMLGQRADGQEEELSQS